MTNVKRIVNDCLETYEREGWDDEPDENVVEFLLYVLETYEEVRRDDVNDRLKVIKRKLRDHEHIDGEVVVKRGVFDD